ncbi:hypothetical protein V6V47_09350 [Micromonospora sp. CPCC 205539]|uniref:hypothetical protein n=1 Tax=Micromonospora sp. CPCC 205539 TaxID=3122408 RepID=UPI002FF00353
MTYYAIYRDDERTEGPAGLFVMDAGTGQAILWDHRNRAWAYDPGLVVRFLNDYRKFDRYETVDRAAAQSVARIVAGGASLPDEEAILAMFAAGARGGRLPPTEGQ